MATTFQFQFIYPPWRNLSLYLQYSFKYFPLVLTLTLYFHYLHHNHSINKYVLYNTNLCEVIKLCYVLG
jgi:hypothetical protein